ncbi:PREDICTED: solute carrier organic anion transporter family member 1B1 [Elephantulus edwardii]|uniref:solute carrier organic anion transporter family member 1B1 n=1 Tax=Elephantulus edwardii TaxID=28737 RepID=UPI0003F07FE1|nr:PREDICTED: solute carrier organic anion transporter family member 1B1 [Elephantulus edwardii]
MDQNHPLNSTAEEQPSVKRKTRCCNGFKVFFIALSFSFIAKTLAGSIMKTSITQIERRFDISSSVAGLIDGSFEIGNLLFIVFVSYFGSRLHRPRLIGIGCIVMGIGSILTALPHFFMGYYRYSKENNFNLPLNSTSSVPTCSNSQFNRTSSGIVENGCVKESGSSLWIYVLMGNMLRGIGETPIVPLGISYIDDFAKEGHSSFYVGSLNAIAMLGPMSGFLLSSFLATIYVDIGYVDLSSIRITPKDSRWVGAWWLGFLVAGIFAFVSSIPFFFLPKSLKKTDRGRKFSVSSQTPKTKEEMMSAKLTIKEQKITENVLGFFQSLKSILTNPLYVIYLIASVLNFSNHVGGVTYVFKHIEQQYGKSIGEANFWIGVISLPTFSLGLFLGGYIIKKFKLNVMGISKLSLLFFVLAFLFQSSNFFLFCETKSVAGLTLTYDGKNSVTSHRNVPRAYCNIDCNCDESQWEPVCGENGMIYVSPCLAGCRSSGSKSKSKFNVIFFYRNVEPELKSLAVGFHSLTMRSLGGILAPIYFGALIDKSCLKWSINSCGKQGSCRIYDSKLYGNYFFGLMQGLSLASIVFLSSYLYVMKRKHQGKGTKTENGVKMNEASLEPLNNNGHFVSSVKEDGETPN